VIRIWLFKDILATTAWASDMHVCAV
jgi:hypothetical protein